MSIPQDIAIAGFDNSLLAKETSPKLTALAQPLDEIGKKSVEILFTVIMGNIYAAESFHLFGYHHCRNLQTLVGRQALLRRNRNSNFQSYRLQSPFQPSFCQSRDTSKGTLLGQRIGL